jgi:hypothetical protein
MASQSIKGGYESIPGQAKSIVTMATKVVSDQPKQLSGEEEYVLNLDPTAVQGKKQAFGSYTCCSTPYETLT